MLNVEGLLSALPLGTNATPAKGKGLPQEMDAFLLELQQLLAALGIPAMASATGESASAETSGAPTTGSGVLLAVGGPLATADQHADPTSGIVGQTTNNPLS